MNPNHPYNGSFPNLNIHSFSLPENKPGSQLFNLPAPGMFAPLQRPPLDYFSSLNQPKSEKAKHPSSFDLVIDPTKRIKHEQNNFTETGFKVEDVPLQKEDTMAHPLLRNLLANPERLVPEPPMSQNEKEAPGFRVENDLTMRDDPSLRYKIFGNNLGEMGNDIPPEVLEMLKSQQMEQFSTQQMAQQLLIKQLEQQRAEALAKQEMLKRLQQQQFEMFMQQKLYQQLQKSVNAQLLGQMQEGNPKPDNLSLLNPQQQLFPYMFGNPLQNQFDAMKGMAFDDISNLKPDPYFMQKIQSNNEQNPELWKNKKTIDESDLQRKRHNNPLIESKNNQSIKKVEIISPPKASVNIYENFVDSDDKELKETKQSSSKEKPKAKKRRSYNYSYDYFNSISNGALELKSKSENRRKNKWQMMAQESEPLGTSRKSTRMQPSRKSTLGEEENGIALQDQNSVQNVAGNQEFVETVNQNAADNFVTKGHRNLEPEDDSNVDYEQLLCRTITKVVNPSTSEEGFAVIDHRERMGKHYEECGEQPFNTSVGITHQAAIPELDLTDAPYDSKKRRCELIWSPKAIDEAEVERYLNDLCQILNCQSVNQEKALKLLKRKNYKKDKVKVNISKNEKFYSSFLVALDPIRDDSSKEKL